jgi:hypothetical protein
MLFPGFYDPVVGGHQAAAHCNEPEQRLIHIEVCIQVTACQDPGSKYAQFKGPELAIGPGGCFLKKIHDDDFKVKVFPGSLPLNDLCYAAS